MGPAGVGAAVGAALGVGAAAVLGMFFALLAMGGGAGHGSPVDWGKLLAATGMFAVGFGAAGAVLGALLGAVVGAVVRAARK